MMQNIEQISATLKMLNICASDDLLCVIKWYDALINNEHHCNHEVRKVEHAKEHGCCVVYDKTRNKFARAGSVSNKIGHSQATEGGKGRMNGHEIESKK